jgi:hypothetical protein
MHSGSRPAGRHRRLGHAARCDPDQCPGDGSIRETSPLRMRVPSLPALWHVRPCTPRTPPASKAVPEVPSPQRRAGRRQCHRRRTPRVRRWSGFRLFLDAPEKRQTHGGGSGEFPFPSTPECARRATRGLLGDGSQMASSDNQLMRGQRTAHVQVQARPSATAAVLSRRIPSTSHQPSGWAGSLRC